jgi:ankyrin repeat protein
LLCEINDYKFSFFHIVAKFGKVEDLRKVILTIDNKNLNNSDCNQYTALHHASIAGNPENVRILIDYGANINVKSSNETRNWLPIHYASKHGFKEIVMSFLDAGVDRNATTSFGLTPLHIACIRGNLGVIQALLMAGADINAKDIDGNTPCHFCSEYGHKDCLRYLLLKHPSLFSKNKEGLSPLDVAVNTEILQVRALLFIIDFPGVHNSS